MDLHNVALKCNGNFISFDIDRSVPSPCSEMKTNKKENSYKLKCTCRCTCNDDLYSAYKRSPSAPQICQRSTIQHTDSEFPKHFPQVRPQNETLKMTHSVTTDKLHSNIYSKASCSFKSQNTEEVLLQINQRRDLLSRKIASLQEYKSFLLQRLDQINLETLTNLSSSDGTDSRDSGVASIQNDCVSKSRYSKQHPIRSILKKRGEVIFNEPNQQTQFGCDKDPLNMSWGSGSPNIEIPQVVRNHGDIVSSMIEHNQPFPRLVDRHFFLKDPEITNDHEKKSNQYDDVLDFLDDRTSDPPSPAPTNPHYML